MSYSPDGHGLPMGDPMASMLAMDLPDQSLQFGSGPFVDEPDFSSAALSDVYSEDVVSYAGTFDAPFPYQLDTFDAPIPESSEPEPSSTDRDNKLLGFSAPVYNYTALDINENRALVAISAQLHGMFFLAESPWAATGSGAEPPAELTCYRRNIFQISGTVTLPRGLRYILTAQGERIPIVGQEVAITATESIKGNQVGIISVPWKSSNHSSFLDDKSETDPPAIPVDLIAKDEHDSEYVVAPISWKRLQFRIATANNGRRKGLQQHFVVRVNIVVTLVTGEKVTIAQVQSSPIIVRGRSPRNFSNGNEYPLSGNGSYHRGNQSANSNRSNSAQQQSTSRTTPTEQPPQLSPVIPRTSSSSRFYSSNSIQTQQQPPTFLDWGTPNVRQSTTSSSNTIPQSFRSDLSLNQTIPLHLPVDSTSPDPHPRSSSFSNRNLEALPIDLSITEETPKRRHPGDDSSPQRKATRISVPGGGPGSSHNQLTRNDSVNSPDGTGDLLYEYFPLGVNDWMPPVDAVYRPHAVHHTHLMPDVKAQAMRVKSKRYFSADDQT